MLKEQIELFIGVINILKTENDERSQKLQEMKQLVAIRHEELTRLEVCVPLSYIFFCKPSVLNPSHSYFSVLQANNYALNMHLRQAQQRDPNPRSF